MNKLKEVKVCSIQLFQLTLWEDKLKLSFSSDLWKKSFFATLNFSIVILELKVVYTSGKSYRKMVLGVENLMYLLILHEQKYILVDFLYIQLIPRVPFGGLAEQA